MADNHRANPITFYVGVALYSLVYLACGVYFIYSILNSRYKRGDQNEIVMTAFVVDNISKVSMCAFLSCVY